jgi:hypothetical protein
MATENRRLRESREPSEPSQTGARTRLTDSSAVVERGVLSQGALDAGALDGARVLARSSRPGIRPSAFGLPRQRPSDPATVTTAVERASVRPASIPPTPSEPPRVSQTVRKKQPARPAVKTDIEELLPLSQSVKSLPLPPKLPTFEAPQLPPPTTRRFPVMSLSIFAVVLGASLAPLARYRGERTTSAPPRQLAGMPEVDWSSLGPLAHEPKLWGQTARDRLLEEGERALAAGDASAAESAFVQALAFGVEDAAFGLARVRLAQGDLQGARGWAENALRRQPQDARYRQFVNELDRRRKR